MHIGCKPRDFLGETFNGFVPTVMVLIDNFEFCKWMMKSLFR